MSEVLIKSIIKNNKEAKWKDADREFEYGYVTTEVVDGKNIKVRKVNSDEEYCVKLENITVPTLMQPLGIEARSYMLGLTREQGLGIKFLDRNSLKISPVMIRVNNRDLAEMMVECGYAYSKFKPYRNSQNLAKMRKTNIWNPRYSINPKLL